MCSDVRVLLSLMLLMLSVECVIFIRALSCFGIICRILGCSCVCFLCGWCYMSGVGLVLWLLIVSHWTMCVELHAFGCLSLITSLFVLRIQLLIMISGVVMWWGLLVLCLVCVCYVLNAGCRTLVSMYYVLGGLCYVFAIVDCYWLWIV